MHQIKFKTVEIELPERRATRHWIIKNQLGRRNLTPEAVSYLRGLRYNIEKQQGRRSDLESDELSANSTSNQNDSSSDTASRLAEEYKVGSATVIRDGRFASAVDKLADVAGKEVRTSILSRSAKLTKKGILELAKEACSHPDKVQRKFKNGKFDPVEDFREKTSRPNPFQVGEVVEIITKKDPRLKSKGGYWAIVTSVNPNNTCDIKLWNGWGTVGLSVDVRLKDSQ